MEKKYKLLKNDTVTVIGRTLYRIEALRDFANVRKGDKGGYVEKKTTYRMKVIAGYLVTLGSVTKRRSMAMRWSVAMPITTWERTYGRAVATSHTHAPTECGR